MEHTWQRPLRSRTERKTEGKGVRKKKKQTRGTKMHLTGKICRWEISNVSDNGFPAWRARSF